MERNQSGFNDKGQNIDVHFQVADVHRPIIAAKSLTAIGCEVESMTAGRRWKLEQRLGQFFLTVA